MAGTRILIAEDESLIAEELKDRLERMGLQVISVVATGEDAITRATQTSPDLVLMDIRLKGDIDGVEAAAAIRDRLDIPVVYLTAHSDEATINRAKQTAPFGYLIKPFVERELRVTVELALHKHELDRQLKESEEKFVTTLTSIGDAVIATDADGRVTFMNPVAETLTRWQGDDAMGLPSEEVFKIVDPDTRAVVDSPVGEALREERVVTLRNHTILIGKDGTELPINDTAAPILDARRRVRGAVLVFRDITERRRAEETLRLAEEQLRHAQRMEAIGRLAGGVAHDFNNLMTVVIGNGELALRQLDPNSRAWHWVKEMRNAGDRAAAITRQLLAFGRKQRLRAVAVSLTDIVSGMERMLGRMIGEDIEVVCILEPELDTVMVDPGQMEQVMLNLAINARDAMPHGGKLTLETRNVLLDELNTKGAPEVQPGRHVMLGLTDTGSGMSADTKVRLFEPFSPPRESARAPASGWPASTASSSSPAATSTCTANWSTERRSRSTCPESLTTPWLVPLRNESSCPRAPKRCW